MGQLKSVLWTANLERFYFICIYICIYIYNTIYVVLCWWSLHLASTLSCVFLFKSRGSVCLTVLAARTVLSALLNGIGLLLYLVMTSEGEAFPSGFLATEMQMCIVPIYGVIHLYVWLWHLHRAMGTKRIQRRQVTPCGGRSPYNKAK